MEQCELAGNQRDASRRARHSFLQFLMTGFGASDRQHPKGKAHIPPAPQQQVYLGDCQNPAHLVTVTPWGPAGSLRESWLLSCSIISLSTKTTYNCQLAQVVKGFILNGYFDSTLLSHSELKFSDGNSFQCLLRKWGLRQKPHSPFLER